MSARAVLFAHIHRTSFNVEAIKRGLRVTMRRAGYPIAVDTPDYAQCRRAIVNERLPTAEPTPGQRLVPVESVSHAVCADHPLGVCVF
jgi:hypothetical protein